MKRLLTLEDLYTYYSSTAKSTHFNSSDENSVIVVQVPGVVNFAEADSNEGLRPVTLYACHDNINANGSNIDTAVMESALTSIKNKPILGFIHEVDGEWQFYKHNYHEDENGEIVYDERPVGIIPESCNAHLEYDEDAQVNRVVVNGYLFEEYSKAVEILERERKCDVSVELGIKALSYDAEKKCLNIEDFYFNGVTILGVDDVGEKINPGMKGSNIQLSDFSLDFNSRLVDTLNRLDEVIQKFNIEKDSTKGGENEVNKFEELLAKYEVTAEDIKFEYEGVSDEELEALFEEAFKKEDPEIDNSEHFEENKVISFEISHDDVKYALYNLLEAQNPNDWCYIINVYDDYFVYQNMSDTSYWGQKYTKNDTDVAFDGERYELFIEMLTKSEKSKLDEMRSNYDSLNEKYNDAAEKLAKYESEPEKINILESKDYELVSGTDEFAELSKRETYFDMTIDEVRAKADQILLNYAKAQKFSAVSNKDEKHISSKHFAKIDKKESRYGDLFIQR